MSNKVVIIVLGILIAGAIFLFTNKNSDVILKDDINEITYNEIAWEDEIGDFTNQLEISPQTAIKIGETVLLESNPYCLKDKPSRCVEKIIDKDIYIVSYYKSGTLGNSYSMAINYKTCEILKFWAGE